MTSFHLDNVKDTGGEELSYHICTYLHRCTCYVFLTDWLIINFGQLRKPVRHSTADRSRLQKSMNVWSKDKPWIECKYTKY